jgi:hypothetical protein
MERLRRMSFWSATCAIALLPAGALAQSYPVVKVVGIKLE